MEFMIIAAVQICKSEGAFLSNLSFIDIQPADMPFAASVF